MCKNCRTNQRLRNVRNAVDSNQKSMRPQKYHSIVNVSTNFEINHPLVCLSVLKMFRSHNGFDGQTTGQAHSYIPIGVKLYAVYCDKLSYSHQDMYHEKLIKIHIISERCTLLFLGCCKEILTSNFQPWPFVRISLLSMGITPEISWWYDDRNIVKKVWQTDGQMDMDRWTELFLELLSCSQKNTLSCLRVNYHSFTLIWHR